MSSSPWTWAGPASSAPWSTRHGGVLHAERHPTDARARAGRGRRDDPRRRRRAGRRGAEADGLDPVAVGIAVPGVVDEARGVAVWSANVGFRDVPLRDAASRAARPARRRSATTCGSAGWPRPGSAPGRGSRPRALRRDRHRHRAAPTWSRHGCQPARTAPPARSATSSSARAARTAAAASPAAWRRWRRPPRSGAATRNGPAGRPSAAEVAARPPTGESDRRRRSGRRRSTRSPTGCSPARRSSTRR